MTRDPYALTWPQAIGLFCAIVFGVLALIAAIMVLLV